MKITAEPNDGYIFNGVSVVETSGDTVHTLGGWFTDNKVVFTMPQNSVTVTPFFSQDYYINMPFEKTCNATIPEGVKAFKIYDAAGKNEDYVLGSVYSSVNNEQELVLTAPNGYGFKMTGSISGNQTGSSGNQIGYSSFTIYDGANTDVSVLWKKQFYNDGKSVDIGEIYSSDRDMTLYLRTSDSALSKLDLNVLVYKIPVSNILVNQVPNGQVISEKNSEQKNHEVSLLVEPAEGYFLKGISIKDAENNDVSYKTIYAWDARNRATITFTMPATDVSVTPTFADENITANDGVYVNMTYKGNDTVYIPKVVKSFKVYDNGGMSGYYRIGSADTLVLIAPENFNLKVEGRISAYNDTLYIYDGENDLENLIFKKTENYKIDEYYSIGRGLKFYFWSRSWSDGSGFDLYVTVYPNRSITLNQTPNGYLSIDKEISPVGLLRTLNVLPVEGYALKSINITDTEGKNVSYKSSAWDEHNGVTITFTMPARDVSITPVFADENITADDGAYINMTYRGNDTVFIPKAVESLKVYDNGGASEKYSANSADTLVLDAPENCILKVEGSMNSLLDSLLIFDGESDIENLLFKSKENTNYSKIGEYYSTGRRLTFYFGSRPGDVSSGFNLKVTVVPLDLFDITLKQVANGGISVRQSKALPFENVTLTAEPDEGYVFAGATATTSSGSVEVFGDWYTDNKAVFKMPQGDVVVTPKFVKKSNDLVINMPYQGKVEATITEGIDSFYVYDNGGTSYYDYNSADTLVLTAPKNKKIALFTGNSKIRINEADLLCVYDGCDTKAEVVFCGADYFSNNPSYYEKYSYYSKLSELRSSMRCLTLQFKSSTRKSYGFELGVSLVDTDPPSVTLNQVPNGIVRAEKRGDSVTVFAEPDKNYIIDKIEIRDAKGNNIWHDSTYLWNAKRSTAYSFTMPKNDVVVTPTFTDDFSNWIGNNDNPYVEPYVLMPYQGKINAVVPDYVNRLSIMSNQGPDDFYKANSADTVVLNTCVNGRIIIDDIEFWLKKGNTLSIYDGANTNSPQLFNIDSYYFAYGINLQSSTNAMTFTFKSGSVDGSPFWVNLSTECPQVEDDKLQIVIRENEGGSVSTEQKTALSGDTVTLAINVKEGYVWEDLVVKDNSSNEVPCEYTLDAESRVIATFVMPNSDVIVVPKFFNVSSLADEYYVNMKYYKWLTFDISAEQESFKVYDNGGKIFDSHADSRDTLTLTAPEGYVVLLDGTYSGTLDLHDGDNINADKFSLGNWSSGRSVTLFFYGSYKNVDLTAKVVRADLVGPHYVTVLQNSSGNVTANKEKYYKSQKVTLTAKPNKGYILTRIVVKNSQGDEIPCDMVYLWNSDKETKVTFSMPSSDVTVTPYFDYKITTKDGIYASMSKYYNRTNEINIPTEIESFKINGSFLHLSDEGNFVSTLSDDYLILVAPNGYGIKLTGSISTGAFANGSLYMYDSLFVNDYNNTKTFFAGRSEIPFVESVVGELECGNKVRLSFKTYSPVSYSPIDLTASLYQLNPYTVTVNQATHGKIVYKDGKTITNTSALGNESISWTVNLDEGYRLESVNIKGASGLDVPYTINDNWYVNKKAEISFVMPKEAVTVTPVYSSDLYIDMKYRERILTDISSNNISFNIYDHGGINGEYKENSRDTLVLKAPSGYSWKLTGSLITEASRDSLYVYNGYSPSAGLLYADCSKKNNQAEDVGEIYSSHQYMTIVFNSGASFNYDGLNLNASVVPRTRFSVKAMRSNGSLNGFNRYSATRKVYSDYELYGIFYGDTVTVEDRPDNGYHLKSVHIEDASGNEIPVSYNWVSSDNQISTKANITFVMPRNDITITPEFTDDDESYSFINMAYRKKMTVDVAVQSFKVYDNGGVNGDYNLGSRDTLVLIPPQGYGFKLTGSINTERGYDSLYVYDGTQMDNKLFVGNSEQSGKVLDIDEIYTYGSMTLRFKSDNYHNYAGLDLTVTLVKIPYTIAEIQQQQYTGKVITPALSVMYGRTLLTENTDYTLTYSNNVNTGTAQVRIKGLGDNVIDTTVTFEIVAKQTDYASVQILEDQNGTRATINADYSGKEPIYVPDAVTVDNIEIKRNLLPLTPATIVLPFQLPEGTTFNARFYYLKEVKQEGCSWTAVMKNIGSKNLPKANTPYAVILNEGEKKLEFDLHGAQATVYTDKIAENWDASDKWQFVGTYSYKVWEEGNDEIGLVYGFAGSNEKGIAQGEFGRIKVGAYAVPMRSYLKKRDSDVRIVGCAQGILAKGASHSINFSNDNTIGVEFVDGEETTAIGRMNPATGEFKIDRWYDLKGRRVNDVKRAAKGAYYGKKTFKK